ncbi:PREDICTED: 26S proteasome non-ATPase regulatory subunit 1-like [Nicrophorus vespilloides]|uniref:26S proteasome non-ATPase regulatory subunit 1-like n=1 Tax=Nicrophorus vespilloides TaxID=110193 RepID=A0ABM1MUL4_NICVS|nr:PREDICTED: 26S proteasome non-ATPase regulatory subunit 1-like [Nicrophorus vespilloides]
MILDHLSRRVARSPDQCPSVVSLLAESYNPHVRYGAAMALGIACAGTGLREAIAILDPIIRSDRINFVRQGALIASAMICIQQTEQTCPKVTFFRQQYADIIKDKHEDVMSKYGAILAQGIINAGGRNTTMSLQSRTGHINMVAVVGTLIFTQYWYWFPLSHCLSLAFTPTCLIGLNGALNMPKMQFKSNAKPSFYGYPAPTEEKKREEMVKTSSALLSIAARRGRRDKYKIKNDSEEKIEEKKSKTESKQKIERPPIAEPDFEFISNPTRVMRQQLKSLELVDDAQYIPIKDVSIGGIIMFRNIKPEQEEIVEMVAAHGPKADDDKEADPPEPFEWHEK